MTTTLNIPDERMGELVGAAILQELTPERRDALLKSTLQYLLTKDPQNTYGRNKDCSPLQAAFNNAAVDVAGKLIKEQFENSLEIRTKIEELVMEGIVKFTTHEREKVVDKMAELVAGLFRVDRY